MTDIFLSYSSKDRERVRPVRDALVAAGYSVFWDVKTPTGEDWDLWIRRNLGEAKVAVVFWTKLSAASPNVRHEAAIARKLNKLVPAMLESMDVDDFPMGFYTTQAAPLHDWTGAVEHDGYAEFARAIRKRIDSDPASVAEVVRQEDRSDFQVLETLAIGGDPAAQVELAHRYSTGLGVTPDVGIAVLLYRSAAESGNKDAQFGLGLAREDGRGMPADFRDAARLYELAARKGHAGAQHNLAVLMINGRIDRNEAEAARLFRLAAEQGLASSQYALGYMHENGFGVGRDDRYAAELYELAARQGMADALFSLGLLCAEGRGMSPDNNRASRLWRLAALQGVKKKRLPEKVSS